MRNTAFEGPKLILSPCRARPDEFLRVKQHVERMTKVQQQTGAYISSRTLESYSGSASKSHSKLPLVITTICFLAYSSDNRISPLFISQVMDAISALLPLLLSSPGVTTI